ncbi:hypothetical protein BJV78DRAFT_272227 [Lactifluus subvellereus]|nr:hypothetical protein BJV78DRAFT_272227 [Lactifluus subvellereus]
MIVNSTNHPLSCFIPRNVTAKQVRRVMEGNENPFTRLPHSPQYYQILEARKNCQSSHRWRNSIKWSLLNQGDVSLIRSKVY